MAINKSGSNKMPVKKINSVDRKMIKHNTDENIHPPRSYFFILKYELCSVVTNTK